MRIKVVNVSWKESKKEYAKAKKNRQSKLYMKHKEIRNFYQGINKKGQRARRKKPFVVKNKNLDIK